MSAFFSIMGNAIPPCCNPNVLKLSVKLIFWEGTTKTLTRKIIAGELMFQFPNMVVCQANSFYIGHPVPALSINDRLVPGETYLLLPIERFACKILSISLISSMVSTAKPPAVNFGRKGPFQYIEGKNGETLINVSPEFLTEVILQRLETSGTSSTTTMTSDDSSCSNNVLISTPELKQHYDQLVGYSKERVWSPKLDTISERRKRSSPAKFLMLETR